MFKRISASFLLILLFGLGLTHLPVDAHAAFDCSPASSLSYNYQNLKDRPSTGSCAANCCTGFANSSCGSGECLDIDPSQAMIPAAGMRDHSLPKTQCYSRFDAAGSPSFMSIEQRRFSSSTAISTPLYIKNLAILC